MAPQLGIGNSLVAPVSTLMNSYSVLFDGTNDYMTASLTLPVDNYTISSWVKWDSTGSDEPYWFDNRDASQVDAIAVYFQKDSGKLRAIIYHSRSQVSTTAYDMDGDVWVHLALVKNGATFNLYKNGVLWVTDAGNSNSANGGTLSLGARYTISNYFDGLIDEGAVFDSVLSAAQVSSIYNGGKPQSLTSYNPVGWWRMGDNDGGTGSTITDQGSGSNDGALINSPAFSTTIP